jgi:replication fork clamp-binding protein CrfC
MPSSCDTLHPYKVPFDVSLMSISTTTLANLDKIQKANQYSLYVSAVNE